MLKNKLLVVVDYQNDFVDGSLGFERAKQIEPAVCDKISSYLSNGYDVVFTMDTHPQKYLFTSEGRHLPVKHCIKGTPGWNLHGKVAELAQGHTLIEKPTFGGLELARYIESKNYSEIELCGIVSNICVISNAVMAKAASPESEITVDALCVASNDPDMEQKAFDIMENLHVRVVIRVKT